MTLRSRFTAVGIALCASSALVGCSSDKEAEPAPTPTPAPVETVTETAKRRARMLATMTVMMTATMMTLSSLPARLAPGPPATQRAPACSAAMKLLRKP